MNKFKPVADDPRTYLDYTSEEYSHVATDQRLLNLALFLHDGGSLHQIVADYRNAKGPEKTCVIYDTLLGYLVYLRTGELVSWLTTFLEEKLTEWQVIELLSAELSARLMHIPGRHPKDADGYKLDFARYYDAEGYTKARYEADQKMIYGELLMGQMDISKDTRESLEVANLWLNIAQEIEADNYENPSCAVHPEDRAVVEEFNAYAQEQYRLRLNLPPEPFLGNPLDAEVVILVLNPGFDEECNIGKYEALDELERKRFIQAKCASMSMQDKSCIPDNKVINEIGAHYWEGKLKSVLEIAGANAKIAVIQFLGYFSEKYSPIPKRLFGEGESLLYTQQYTMRLIRYLMQTDKVIIIARSKKKWYRHVPELKTYSKKVVLSSYGNPTVSAKNCIDGGFELIKEALLK